ncbi:hypothetical protein [Glacieibacterium frigidum]|uniref:Uncharacterized protein n=1 Tax=Glacieibacterium frigidum TaxID=2593303 RepID=A0A552UF66_9SPHN|nr:hypothetical protein [Glacieibacterium frigidum]TRW16863.1 hypothetical protein FMM06_01245 [Glacieibacterium frigidum]
MKIFLTLTAAALASTAAIAQTASPGAPAMQQPGMSAPTTAPTAPTTTDTAPMASDTAPAASAAPAGTTTASAEMMVERDGKWFMGDRPATKAEIKAHKKMMKTPS